MNEEKINRWHSINLIAIGVLALVYGVCRLCGVEIPHGLQMAVAVLQILIGGALIYTTVRKLKGKF